MHKHTYMCLRKVYNRRARGVRPARRVRRASSPRQYTTVVKCLVVVPVEEEECEGGGDQEGEHLVGVRGRIRVRVRVRGRGRGSGRVRVRVSEHQQPEVARVLRRGVEQLVAAHQVLGCLLRL